MYNIRSLPTTIVFACALSTVFGQIPNGGFENWSNQGGYMEPVGWLTYNDVQTLGGATVEQGTPGNPGNFHAVISTRESSGGGFIQGWASAGMSGTNAGFPYAARPAMLTGQWQYGIQPNDTAQIQVALNNGGSGTLVALGTLEVTGSLGSWQTFQVPLTYISSDIPDTAYIQIVSSINFSSPVVGSFIKVDDLAFAGSVGMDEPARSQGPILFPSPASDVLSISPAGSGELLLMDATGRVVLRSRTSAQVSSFDVSHLAPGLYTFQMLDPHGRPVASGRWVKE